MSTDAQIEETIKYVTVPVEKEVIVKVPKTEYVDRIVEVPKVQYQMVEKVVEVPKVNFVEKLVEKVQYVDKVKPIPRVKTIEVPVETVTYVNKVDVQVVEKEVEVPGQIIEVPKRVEVVNEKIVHKYIDNEVPTVVAQTYRPNVEESQEHVQTAKLKKYVPYLIPVQVYVPVAVDRDLVPGEQTENMKQVDIPAPQLNAQIKNLNPNLSEEELLKLYKRNPDGSVAVFEGPGTGVINPQEKHRFVNPVGTATPEMIQTTHGQTRIQNMSMMNPSISVTPGNYGGTITTSTTHSRL
ncbi:inner membrane complex protein [Gregarina niphandrodes]|uniref:Inner membrane complex protein n=1 Tax=Gregarina niphandrodes TaxID=110365 RepID=A0A023B0R9_GRENI|nr:inner membrane complex protein [Gregarina niphandrodes]EZG45752.1 inner membrane complex protein [Gregarina niphandrodes]|eukprot:XP_011132458.1 inner membrane complex protein [Gregarina niphandrodes]